MRGDSRKGQIIVKMRLNFTMIKLSSLNWHERIIIGEYIDRWQSRADNPGITVHKKCKTYFIDEIRCGTRAQTDTTFLSSWSSITQTSFFTDPFHVFKVYASILSEDFLIWHLCLPLQRPRCPPSIKVYSILKTLFGLEGNSAYSTLSGRIIFLSPI